MKKIIVLGFALLLLLNSCSPDALDANPGSPDVSDAQLQDLKNSNPELLLTLLNAQESANNRYLNSFATGDNGNLHDDFGHMAVNLGTDMMGNDMWMTQSNWFVTWYNYNARAETSSRTDMVWSFYYRVIRNVNDALRSTEGVTSGPFAPIRGRLLAMRAFAYFQLIRIYGNGEEGIPLSTNEITDLSRVATSTIYEQILTDLNEAYGLLADYTRTSKVQINQKIVAGFLARFYLERGDYAQAATYAAEARAGYLPMDQGQLFDGFNKITNTEWMWGADIDATTTTFYASFFSNMGNLNPGYAGLLGSYKCVDKRIYDNITVTDARKGWFTDDGNPYDLPKYANVKFVDDTTWEGDYVFMRASEMYLIEAEAQARSGNEAAAKQTLYDFVSTRDSGYTLSTKTGNDLLEEIRYQKKLELWGEGFSWFDMKREHLPLQRDYAGTNHNSLGFFNYPADSPKFIFQIPIAELNTNGAITNQNPF